MIWQRVFRDIFPKKKRVTHGDKYGGLRGEAGEDDSHCHHAVIYQNMVTIDHENKIATFDLRGLIYMALY